MMSKCKQIFFQGRFLFISKPVNNNVQPIVVPYNKIFIYFLKSSRTLFYSFYHVLYDYIPSKFI